MVTQNMTQFVVDIRQINWAGHTISVNIPLKQATKEERVVVGGGGMTAVEVEGRGTWEVINIMESNVSYGPASNVSYGPASRHTTQISKFVQNG